MDRELNCTAEDLLALATVDAITPVRDGEVMVRDLMARNGCTHKTAETQLMRLVARGQATWRWAKSPIDGKRCRAYRLQVRGQDAVS